MNVCICGGGNLGHVTAGYLSSKEGFDVNILTRHPERWSGSLEITLPDGKSVIGKLGKVTSDPASVIPQADIAIICLPGMYIRQY